MAGQAGDLAAEAGAAVDAGDDAKRQVTRVEHRALFNVHLDVAQVASRVALEGRDVFHLGAQTCVFHGLAQGDALGIDQVQPAGLEVAHQGTGAQEGGGEALAFFFGKGDHFDAVAQTAACTGQALHAHHGHEDAQAAVVATTVTHGVIV